ncbi:MAG: MFS transporter, partial [Bacteroidaceae bacterium]|nr:MFS transporter [Bacteroidaceae bacterium]
VKERVKNDTPPENFLSGLKAAVQNKYWIICIVFTLMTNMMLYFNLSVSVYYLNSVVNNMGLMGAYVAACNMPGVIVMFIMPFVLHKVSKKNLALINTFPIHGTIHTNGS